MMRGLFLPLLLLALPLGAQADVIAALVTKLSSTHGLWVNGLSPEIDLPDDATSTQVLDKMFASISFDKGKVTTYTRLEERKVAIPPEQGETYKAILLDSDQGQWIVLTRYEGPRVGWWTRCYRPGQ